MEKAGPRRRKRVAATPKDRIPCQSNGFSTQQKGLLLPPIVAALEELGLEVWEPFARNNQIDFAERG